MKAKITLFKLALTLWPSISEEYCPTQIATVVSEVLKD